MTAHTKTLHCS